MISFVLKIDTHFGQDMFIVINNKQYPMTYSRKQTWTFDYTDKIRKGTKYQYIMRDVDGSFLKDTPKYRYLPTFETSAGADNAEPVWTVEDEFGYRSLSSVFETKAFANCLMKQNKTVPLPQLRNGECLLVLNAPGVETRQYVRIVGEHPLLGSWNPAYGLEMTPGENGWWWAKLPVDSYLTHVQYKFVVLNRADNTVAKWETGENRRLPVVSENKILSASVRIDYNWHGQGVAIPVFSLRSKSDWGVGEFADLKRLADWAAARNMQLIQILPINDTTSTGTDLDSYPYRANSVHALHPMYLNVLDIGRLKNKKEQTSFENEAMQLNALDHVDYTAVNNLKHRYIRKIFDQNYNDILADTKLAQFVKANAFWIKDYAIFSCLRDIYNTDDCAQWGDFRVYNKRKADKFAKEHTADIYYYYFVQYHLHLQLTDAIDYLHSKGIVIKGDLPIGISAHSVDAWVEPSLFNLDTQAGAPPDDFSVRGQNWGFPTYNWQEMEKTNYQWWKSRFATMDRYFDAFRIDHILGFFRIWEVPVDSLWGVMGHFNPAMPLAVEEIERYGIGFDADRYTKPYVTADYLNSVFGDDMARVATMFFNQVAYDRYELKQEYDTQAKIDSCFKTNNLLPQYQSVYEHLMAICTDVLFLKSNQLDANGLPLYHPRINLFQTNSYNCLSDHEKWCLRRLHDDFFYYRHETMWRNEAMRKLPSLIGETDMLVCGEDLGMVPACVPEVMQKLQILSLEVERMPKDINVRVADIPSAPYLSVCCTGTHDTSTLRMWWAENRDNTQWYYNAILHREGEAPAELTPELASAIVGRMTSSSAMWAILPWQDYMACDGKLRNPDADKERINDPSNPDHIWCWRMHIDII